MKAHIGCWLELANFFWTKLEFSYPIWMPNLSTISKFPVYSLIFSEIFYRRKSKNTVRLFLKDFDNVFQTLVNLYSRLKQETHELT